MAQEPSGEGGEAVEEVSAMPGTGVMLTPREAHSLEQGSSQWSEPSACSTHISFGEQNLAPQPRTSQLASPSISLSATQVA